MLLRKMLMTVLFFSVLTGCATKDDDYNGAQVIISYDEITEEVADTDGWEVTSFIDGGDDESDSFDGYVFDFNDDGTVIATKGNTEVTGEWAITSGSTDGTDTYAPVVFNLAFNTPDVFTDLTGEWYLVTYSETQITLAQDNEGNSEDDYLTFKNN